MVTCRYKVRILPCACNDYFNIFFYLLYVLKLDILFLHFSRSVWFILQQRGGIGRRNGSDPHSIKGCGMHLNVDWILLDTIHYPKFSQKEENQTYGHYGCHTFQVKWYQEFSSIHTYHIIDTVFDSLWSHTHKRFSQLKVRLNWI